MDDAEPIGPLPHPLRSTAWPARVGAILLLAAFPFQMVFAAERIDAYHSIRPYFMKWIPLGSVVTASLVAFLEAAVSLTAAIAALLYARAVSQTLTPEAVDRETIARALRIYFGTLAGSLAALVGATASWAVLVWI